MGINSIPVSLACKLFDILIRPILTYNSEIWYMDDYFSISRSIYRAEQSGSNCDTLALEDKTCYEKIHTKFCKYVLGLRKSAGNIAAKSELGRLPITEFIKTQSLLYFCRLQSEPLHPLLKEAFSICKFIDSNGIYTWYSFINNLFKEYGMEIINFENLTKPFACLKQLLKNKINKTINDSYVRKTLDKITSFNESSKFYLYSKLKHKMEPEYYLTFLNNFKIRQLFTKFRMSDHSLKIEMGRYKNIPREERICKNCDLNEIGDEHHFLHQCTSNEVLRNSLLNKININKQDFANYNKINKSIFLLNNKSELLTEIGNFLKQSTELQKIGVLVSQG